MSKNDQFDYDGLKKKALDQFRSGKSLFGKDGAFAPLLKEFLEAAMEGELDEHLDDAQREDGNRKNGTHPNGLRQQTVPLILKHHVIGLLHSIRKLSKSGKQSLQKVLNIKLLACMGME